jgi:hypothetical protein
VAIDPATALLEVGGKLIDRFLPSQADQDAAKLELLRLHQSGELSLIAAQSSIIKAEAESEHWLASCWRPILMLTFGALIVARWFGWAAPDLSEAEYIKLWSIVELGLGGYVIGRSAEKIVPQVASVLKAK